MSTTTSKRYKRALLIGRFQPPHLGHLHAVQYALSLAEELIIVVGSAQYSHTLENPFTAGERIEMLLRMLEDGGLPRSKYIVLAVPDAPAHSQWVSIIRSMCPAFDVAFTNDPLSTALLSEAGYEVLPVPFLRREELSGTEVRRRIIANKNWTKLVPPAVVRYLKETSLIVRIKKLAASSS